MAGRDRGRDADCGRQGDVLPRAGRVPARPAPGRAVRERRALGRRREPQPALGQRSGAVQAPRRRAPGRARLRAGPAGGAIAARAPARGRGRQDRRGGLRSRPVAGRAPPRGRLVHQDGAALGARRRRPRDDEPRRRPRRRAARPLRPAALAQPGAARDPADERRRLHRADRLRSHGALVAGAAGAAPPRPRRLGLPALERAAAAPRPRSRVLQRGASGPAGRRHPAQRAPGAREPAPQAPAPHHQPGDVHAARAPGVAGPPAAGAAHALRYAHHRHRPRHVRAHLAGGDPARRSPPRGEGGHHARARRGGRGAAPHADDGRAGAQVAARAAVHGAAARARQRARHLPGPRDHGHAARRVHAGAALPRGPEPARGHRARQAAAADGAAPPALRGGGRGRRRGGGGRDRARGSRRPRSSPRTRRAARGGAGAPSVHRAPRRGRRPSRRPRAVAVVDPRVAAVAGAVVRGGAHAASRLRPRLPRRPRLRRRRHPPPAPVAVEESSRLRRRRPRLPR